MKYVAVAHYTTAIYFNFDKMNIKEDLEVWVDIKGYENKYQISNLGRVRSINYHNTGKMNLSLRLYLP